MRVAVLAVGDELLSGDVADTATSHVARALSEHGIRPVTASLCGDAEADIRDALTAAAARAQEVVLTGGLGPTPDDRTRDALAAWAGVVLRREDALVAGVQRWYAERGRAVPPAALRQADVPVGAAVLPNPTGSAPGLAMDGPGARVWALPGVPSEMRVMFAQSVLPALVDRAGPGGAVHTRGLRVVLAGETAVAALLQHVESALPVGQGLSYLPDRGELRVRVTARAVDADAARAAAATTLERVRAVLGDLVVGTGEEPLGAAVHQLLHTGGHTVAVAESLTGGLLGAALTATAGSSQTFRGGVTAYATGAKSALLGVDASLLAVRGAVHPEVAAAMARGARARLGASHAVSTTGVAGPTGQDGQAPGTVFVGLCGPGGERVLELTLAGDRERVRHLSVVHALDGLWRLLRDLPAFDAAALDRVVAAGRMSSPTREVPL